MFVMAGARGLPWSQQALRTTVDFLRLLEAAYQQDQPRDAWCAGLLTAAAFLDRGAGLGLVLYDLSSGTDIRVEALDGLNLTADWKAAGMQMHADPRLVPGIIQSYRQVQCATMGEFRAGFSAARSATEHYYDPNRVQDALFINGLDCSGKGCSLQLFSHETISLSLEERELYCLLAIHLNAAYRLQRRKGSVTDRSDGPEALLRASGSVVHAQGAAALPDSLSDLSAAVVRRESARGSKPLLPPLPALERCDALVSARWTLVDEYEDNGQRFVVARVNPPEPRSPAALSARERQVASLAALGRSNKLIAYELGLAHSTVRVLISRACEKLGVKSRAELVERLCVDGQ